MVIPRILLSLYWDLKTPLQLAAEPILYSPTPTTDKEKAEADLSRAGEATSRRPRRALHALRQLRILDALRHREFRLIWYGQIFSSMATWMDQVARGWLIYELTDSAFQLGLVRGIQAVPILLLSPLAGRPAGIPPESAAYQQSGSRSQRILEEARGPPRPWCSLNSHPSESQSDPRCGKQTLSQSRSSPWPTTQSQCSQVPCVSSSSKGKRIINAKPIYDIDLPRRKNHESSN